MGDQGQGHPTVYLFVHAIWTVCRQEPLLSKPVRKILFAHMQKEGEEKGIKILALNGVDDHIHCLLKLMPSQNLLQVIKSIKTSSAHWLNDNRLLSVAFDWEEGYAAYSVSPSGVQQVMGYIGKQEEYHQSKSLNNELEAISKFDQYEKATV